MNNYYGLNEPAFSLSPNPRYLHLSDQHRMAVSKLRYVIENRQGLAVLYGDIGHGKTSLIRHLYDIYNTEEGYQTVMVTNPHYPSEMQLLKRISDEFHLQRRRSKLDQMEELESFLIHPNLKKVKISFLSSMRPS